MFGNFSKKSRSQKEWKEQTIRYAKAINKFVEVGLKDGWENAGEEPEAQGREEFVPALLDAIRAANQSGELDGLRDDWPIAHTPLISELEKNGQSIPTVSILDDGRIVARIGTEYQDGYVLEIDGLNTKKVEGVDLFGRSPDRRYFAYTTSSGIKITDGWLGQRVALCPYPLGNEGIPNGFEITPFDSPPSPSCLVPFPDGRRVLFVSSGGIFVLTETKAIRLLPTAEDLAEHFEWSKEEYPDDELTADLSMQHGAISPDGRFIAVGSQDGTHLVFDDAYRQVADIGNQSEYPHYALFDSNTEYLALNSCHFYNGVTLGVRTELLEGLKTEPYEQDPRISILEGGARVYAGVHRKDEFIIGDARGYIRAFGSDGKQHWQHFIGSSVGSIDVTPDGETMVCSTYAGFLSIFKMDQGKSADYEIGNSGHTETRRWLIWKNEETPLAW